MSEQVVTWLGDEQGHLQFEGITSYGDPVLIGGDAGGRGAKPSDLLPVSLAACIAYDVVTILKKQRQDLRGLRIAISSEQDPDPPWTFRRITLRFQIEGDVDERKARKAIELSETKYCAVSAAVRPTVDVRTEIEVAR